MTNSYGLFQRPKIVFIHGLNNNPDCFLPLINHFEQLGHETEFLILPGHGDHRDEARDIKTALRFFDQSLKKFKDAPYSVVAFSQGALYLQLWLEKNQAHRPLRQVLLAPALFLNRQGMISKIMKILPGFLKIKGLSPKAFKRYTALNVWEYRTLLEGITTFQKLKTAFKIPTYILIDPKDELVNARRMKEHYPKEVEFYERNYLKKGPGCHHIIFHPDYYHEADWKNFTRKIEAFLVKKN